MAAITRIEANVRTGNRAGAGTDGNIFLGIAGREFVLDSSADDFEQNSNRTYILGVSVPGETTVTNPAHNDPRTDYVLDSGFLDRFPVYIRFEPEGNSPDWDLESATITVKSFASTVASFQNLGGSNHLWLGQSTGKTCYLLRQ